MSTTTSTDAGAAQPRKGAKAMWWAAGAMAAVALAAGAGLAAASSGNAQELAAAQAEVDGVLEQAAAAEASVEEARSQGVQTGLGHDLSRVAQDTPVIEGVLETALTWSSNDDYAEARLALVEEHGLAADSQVLTSFMPPPPGREDADGAFHSLIDARGLNSRFDAATPVFSSFTGTDYSYFVQATFKSSSLDGGASSTGDVLMLITVGDDGSIKSCEMFAADGPVKTTRR